MTRMHALAKRTVFVLAVVAAAACSQDETAVAPTPRPEARGGDTPTQQTLIVSAAASTSDALTRIGEQFSTATGIDVKVNAGPTNGLAAQILAGAPADLFLSASREWADKVAEGGEAAEQVDLLSNRLVIVVPHGNPAGVEEPKDLLSATVKKVSLAGENAPAGIYADQALAKLELGQQLVDAGKVVRGHDVRAALSYVERGDAEAGIVYATDAKDVPAVEIACELDPSLHEGIVYVLVLLKHGAENPAARRLFEFLQGPDARGVYADLGFIPLPVGQSR